MEKPVLIASDGNPGSEGALAMGMSIARIRGVKAEVLAVLEPQTPVIYVELAPVPEAYAMLQTVGADELQNAVTHQVEEIGPVVDWSVSVEVGPPAPTIARYAREHEAGLIVVGTGPRTALERWLRSDTSLKVVQLANVPVLLAPQAMRVPPSTALVAVDFSDFSLRAAKAVLPLMSERGRVYLVHVAWTPVEASSLPSLAGYWKTYEEGAAARLRDLAEELRRSSPVQVETHVITGDPARELVAFAGRFNVDVVAAGSHGRGFFSRLLMGSVSTRLIHGARCSVLIVPPEAAPKELDTTGPIDSA